jgi:tetratricopeptide (TPR) repeat protein
MSVFRAGCTAAALHALRHEAGAAVAPAATRAMLGALQAQSLVQSREEADGSLRFSLFEPIREYAAAQQDAAATRHWRARQRAWALGWAQALPATPPLAEVRTELPNLRAALASAVADGTPDDAVLLLLALQPALEEIGLPSEPLHDAQQAVEACRDHVLRSRGRSALSGLLFTAGEREAALRQARAGLDSVPAEPAMRARALHALGRLAWRSERRADLAEPLLQEALSAAQQAGDLEVQASSLALLGFMQAAPPTADVDGARTLHRRALALWEAAGNQHTINGGRYNLAACDLFMRRFDTALEQLSEVARSSREQQDWLCLSGALDGIGTAMVGLRRWHEALAVQRQAIEAAWPSMSMYDLAFGLWNTPRSLAHVREPEAAWRVLGFAVPFWQARVGALDAADQHYLRLVGRLVGLQVDAARMERLWAEGRRLTLLQAITLALGHAPSGAAL